MAHAFPRSIQSLSAERPGRLVWGLLLVVGLLAGWAAWFFLGRVELYAVTDSARMEVARLIHPVETPIDGKVAISRLRLGSEVRAGDVLVELDAQQQRLQAAEEKARSTAAAGQVTVLRRQIEVEEKALAQEQEAAGAAQEVARARQREEEAVAKLAEQKLEHMNSLQAEGAAATTELLEAKGLAQKERAAADALGLTIKQLELEQKTKATDRSAGLEKLKNEVASLEGQMAISNATIERIQFEIERHLIRAPATGRLGEIADLRLASVVKAGDRLATVVPPGDLRIVADYAPAEALGRIRPEQPARLRLQGFPWTQYGSIQATVTSVGSELRQGKVRVELLARSDPNSLIPREHALPGTLEVQVDRVAPAVLLLRMSGKVLGPAAAAAPSDGK